MAPLFEYCVHERTATPAMATTRFADAFQPISLEQLNAEAAMLERLDNKYVVRAEVLRQAVPELARHFSILEIDGRREFTYETCYFDDAARTNYFDHHRKRRQRSKVRIRSYVDANLCFVEVKLKDKRGVTVKKRMRYDPEKLGILDADAWAHIRAAHGDLYGREFDLELEPAMSMRYRRLTLVAKAGGERMTIDRGLMFSGASSSCAIDEDVFIVETKSANGNGIADKILRGLRQHPSKHCSKYCVGMAALKEVHKHNRFLPAMRKLGVARGSRDSLLTAQVPAIDRHAGRGVDPSIRLVHAPASAANHSHF